MELHNQQLPSASTNLPSASAVHWTTVRLKIRTWLQEQAPALAELYEGAVHLIFEPKFPAKVRFVGHAVREIRNCLPYLFDSNDIDKLNNKEKATRFFESCISQTSENLSLGQVLIPLIEHWWDVTEWFMQKTHQPKNQITQINKDYEEQILEKFQLFETFLETLAQDFYDTTDKLDSILKEAKIESFEKAIALLIHPQQRLYFFNRLNNPLWIEPLKKKGFFKNPPSVIDNSDKGTISFPRWAESHYLARMAEQNPNAVLEIARQIKTENPRVHEDFIEAALQMHPEVAVRLVPKVNKWIKSPYLFSGILPEKIGKLFVYLAKGNQVEKSLELARTLLTIPAPRLKDSQEREIKPRFRDFDYREIIKNYIPELVKVAGKEALKMLGYLLYDAIKFSLDPRKIERLKDNTPIWEDDSIYWQTVIEEHPRNSGSDRVLQSLAIAVRDAAEQIVKNDQSKIQEIVLLLEKWKWRIFHRIALYLIRKFPRADPKLIAEELANPKYFDDSDYQAYEYIFLGNMECD